MNEIESNDTFLPIASLQAVVNDHHKWVALALHMEADNAVNPHNLLGLFTELALHDALGGMDCILAVANPLTLDLDKMMQLPVRQIILSVSLAACVDETVQQKLQHLQGRGFRIQLHGLPAHGAVLPNGVTSLALDCAAGIPLGSAEWLHKLGGPHLAENIDDLLRFEECHRAGFQRFSGNYPLHPASNAPRNEGTSRTRLLSLLGLIARDAESRELEALLKQDPALSYHLLKLVNSAAFALKSHISSFGQAINLLGRRQLQRWLQLLLYAGQQVDGKANPLLPRAALRARLMESICQNCGGNRDEQDLAFMIGMFSLLEVLFVMPLSEIIAPLSLPDEAVVALLHHEGTLGLMLKLVEHAVGDSAPLTLDHLEGCEIELKTYWSCIEQACRWAIQVSRDM
ncbi:MAG: HDOD domain-containing protein [Pseudomonadota bacterium]